MTLKTKKIIGNTFDCLPVDISFLKQYSNAEELSKDFNISESIASRIMDYIENVMD
jgi:hypothetical protein